MTRAILVAVVLGLGFSGSFLVPAKAEKIQIKDLINVDVAIKLLVQELKLNKKAQPSDVFAEELSASGKYRYTRYELKHPQLGTTRLTVRQPRAMIRPLPLVFVVAGASTETDGIKAFNESGDYILALYHFPVDSQLTRYRLAAKILEKAPQIYGQIAFGLKWMSEAPEVTPDRVNTVLVSFGTFVGPLALRIAEPLLAEPVYSTVLAYGGADLKNLILPSLKKHLDAKDYNEIERHAVNLASLAEPKAHMKVLKGRLLVIEGAADDIIPEASRRALVRAVPPTKTVVTLNVPHINTDRPEVIQLTMDEVEKWYQTQGALE